jgi:predicted transcriptional regulator
VELANYFAAAVLMPYGQYLAEALASKYDFDHLATRFGVSFEQACHRATTLQRSGAQGVPFFFLRIDKAGNVTKRFNATDFHLAEYGGACPRLDVHTSFRMPGRIVPQFVEMPDTSQFFVFARTVDRPPSPGMRRTCALPSPWAARWSISTVSAMPRISPPAPRTPRPSASTAASARG